MPQSKFILKKIFLYQQDLQVVAQMPPEQFSDSTKYLMSLLQKRNYTTFANNSVLI